MLPLNCPVYFRHELAPYVTYKIGGPADIFVMPQSIEDMCRALDFSCEQALPVTLLGNGSNLLIRDKGIRGVVIYLGSLKEGRIEILSEDANQIMIRVPANLSKAHLLDWSLLHNLSGLEFSAGIPGTLGGAVFMNAGTKWGSYSNVIEAVQFYSLKKGLYTVLKDGLGLKYRGHGEGLLDGKTIVLSVDLLLKKEVDSKKSRNLVDEILGYRGMRQPLEYPNCGSVFKNPENSEKGAGRLIEAAGLKGIRVGGAQVSLKHANFILNLGTATASDVETLIKKIQKEIFEKFSIQLETEVIILGDN
jgi:UDP-N-acetylmuramate dehydrogenase